MQVPSDVTLLEAQQQTGQRRLRFLERLGLFFTPPVLHVNYSKLDKHAMRAILTRSYDRPDPTAATDICRRRQESVRKRVGFFFPEETASSLRGEPERGLCVRRGGVSLQVVAQNGLWIGALGGGVSVHYTLRLYDYKSKLIALPFLVYAGACVGRVLASGLTGRWREWGRDRALGELPAAVLFAETTAAGAEVPKAHKK